MIKAEYSASLLQSSVSHDPSEIILIYWFAAQETFPIIINVENSCAAQYFCGNSDILILLFSYTFIQLILLSSKDALNWSNVKVNTYNITKISISSFIASLNTYTRVHFHNKRF